MRSPKPQIVIDTNVWISGLIFGGNPTKIIQLFIDGDVLVIASEELLSELRRKIKQKSPLFLPYLPLLEASIREKAIFVQLGTQPVDISRDPDDNKIIETALAGSARYIVSGDKDLLVLGSYEDTRILNRLNF